MIGMRHGTVALVAGISLGCARPAAPPLAPTQAGWTRARDQLARLRASVPQRPYVEQVRVSLIEPRTRRALEARGAVAVQPGVAMRMILVGPGGTTALDVWVTPRRWRIVVPALEVSRRGDADPADTALPIGFLRWWFLGPLDGRLLAADPDRALFVLRAGEDTVTWRVGSPPGTEQARATRRRGNRTESLLLNGVDLTPRAGNRATYVHLASGLRVEVTVEQVGYAPPPPDAFADPDALEGGVS